MITAIVSLKVDRKKVNEVANLVASIAGVSEVYSVTGRYDLVAIVRVSSNPDELASIITEQLIAIEGIVDSETMLAFRAYSKHDLEAMFSIGAE